MSRAQDKQKKKSKTDRYILTPLIPKEDAQLGIYEDALDYVFENGKIRNIALSGAYGSGKSSILLSYKKKTNKDFLHISLAHFDPTESKAASAQQEESEKNGADNQPEISKISLLEWKILNQLIHQIKPKKIPQTNFQLKKNTSKARLILATLSTITFLLLSLYVSMFVKWVGFHDALTVKWIRLGLHFTTCPETRLFALFICVLLAGVGILGLMVLQRNRRVIKKLDVKGAEIEMFKDSDESYFDKYLNEVLYLFENVEQNVIVFEDMDRFDSIAIFERLREVNTLINHSRKGKKPVVRFFYLIRDDIFTNKDRLKFFDLIIPVVPVVDGSNAFDKFIEILEKHSILDHFDMTFLQAFSFYIDEMRLLINICNEYKVYYQRLNEEKTDIDNNKLFAIIAYKNLFPQDFAELQLAHGFMFTLIDSRGKLINSEKLRLVQEIAAITEKIECANNEHLENENEVDRIYKNELEGAQDRLNKSGSNNKGDAQKTVDKVEEKIASRKENLRNRTKSGQAGLRRKIASIEKKLSSFVAGESGISSREKTLTKSLII